MNEPAGSVSEACEPLARRVEELEAELDKHLPISDRFDQEPRSEANEVVVRDFLDGVFTDSGKGKGYELECHGRACRVTIDHQVAREDWMEAVQADPLLWGISESLSFRGDAMHMLRVKEEQRPAKELVARVIRSLTDQQDAFARCTNDHPTRGELVVVVSLDQATRRLVATSNKDLAGTALDGCVRPLFARTLEAIAVPSQVTHFDPLEIPLLVVATKR